MKISVFPVAAPGVSLRRRVIRTLIPTTLALCVSAPLLLLGVSHASAAGVHQSSYSVAVVDVQLARRPTALLGHAMFIRARLAQVCTKSSNTYPGACINEELVLTDPNSAATAAPLPLAWDPTPGDGPTQSLHAGGPAVYRVQLRQAPCTQSPAPVCYGAILLGAAPPFPGAYWM